MIGVMGFTRIFRSRWAALLWASGIMWTAYDVATANTPDTQAPAAKATSAAPLTDAAGSAIDPEDLAALANTLGD